MFNVYVFNNAIQYSGDSVMNDDDDEDDDDDDNACIGKCKTGRRCYLFSILLGSFCLCIGLFLN